MPPLHPQLARLGAGLIDLVTQSLPPRVLFTLAEGAGWAWWHVSPGRRRVVHENLRIAFGDGMDAAERRRVGRASCQGLVRVFAEMCMARRLFGSLRAYERKVESHGDLEALRADHAKGRGGLLVTAHLGNWELGALAIRLHGEPLMAMARPLRNPLLEAWLERRRGGAKHLIPKTGGLRAVTRTLRRGGWVGMLADQNAGRHGLFVPFFGLEASTFPTPAALALRMDLPIYLGVTLRRPRGQRILGHVERLPLPPQEMDLSSRIEALTCTLNERVEAWVRRAPEQYNWVHRRWKTRPPGRDRSEPGQPFYARLWPANHPRTGLR